MGQVTGGSQHRVMALHAHLYHLGTNCQPQAAHPVQRQRVGDIGRRQDDAMIDKEISLSRIYTAAF